jgi:zinc transport system permease protein
MLAPFTNLLEWGIDWFARLWPEYSWPSFPMNVRAALAILMVALVCGAVSSLVVGNRMAFFSDALAHCAFAGVALGFLVALATGLAGGDYKGYKDWITLIMIVFGILVGLGIAWVREKTALASDTVIGVFFAGAIGLGAMFMKAISRRGTFSPENFLFGDPTTVSSQDLVYLMGLVLVTLLFLWFFYNSLVFASFNVSLARSRQVRIRLCNYLFIALLGILVNLCLQIVGALLINALLIVPAATAANLSRNMRQLFWFSIVLCLAVGLGGQWLSWEISIPDPASAHPIEFGVSGTIVVLSVLMFFLSMAVGPWLLGRRSSPDLDDSLRGDGVQEKRITQEDTMIPKRDNPA